MLAWLAATAWAQARGLTAAAIGAWLARIAVLLVVTGIVVAASVLTWRYRDALAEAEAARAERDAARVEQRAAEARVQQLETARAELDRQRREAVAARQAADRRLASHAEETRRLLAQVREARARAAREPQPISPEEAAECRAIVETYRRLLEGTRP